MKNPVELLMERRQIDALINADPSLITPLRKSRVSAPGGGWRWADNPTPIGPYEVLIAPAKRRLSDMLVNTELGDVTQYPYIVVARHTAVLKKDDTFVWQGETFVVKSIHIKTSVSVTAQVDYLGGNRNG